MNPTEDSNDHRDFQLLSDIFETFDEVGEARDAYPISEEEKELLRKMSKGNCSKKEAEAATKLAAENRIAIEFLADCLTGDAA